ncbi:D-2-hydroxyacid dehydrogenase family protein [Paeniglutamicibacter sulfureus]|uniref:Phosphoglycerate dehydrogenase-like enzyme n=1 Tax=Paeniglutamicibacter sulfureus TaxID=43666 RepID=A0ABU2BMX8_9MICC|nr:D-2-hydroxyacid dehydrogenase family protein [Paeniglutamicibacter sulfureus]MDR7358699.1 phosphoglycerate dehydrogenase-like enzyme [Paeniglutamicibacter sulfureus]
MRIAVLDDYQDVASSLADWDSLPGEVVFFTAFLGHDDSAVAAALRDFDVIVAMRERTPFTAERLRRLPSLRLLVTTGMRNASIDLDAASDLGITVCGTAGSPAAATEHTWALIMAAARRLDVELFSAARPAAPDQPWQQTLGTELSGKTLGVYGLGKLGSQVARIGQAFGMRVIAHSQNLTAERAAEVGVELVGEDELFARSDVLTIHLKLSERSTGVVGARQLALMKHGSILVNTSRSAIIDEDALVAALEFGAPALAAIDVFDIEPLPANHRLAHTPGVIATPHLGYVTEDQFRIFYTGAVKDIAAWAAGTPVNLLG